MATKAELISYAQANGVGVDDGMLKSEIEWALRDAGHDPDALSPAPEPAPEPVAQQDPEPEGEPMSEQTAPPEQSGGGDSPSTPVEDDHTTRTDQTDLGVPMEGGSDKEPQGPEDAFGGGPKRGAYGDRQPEGTQHYISVAIPVEEQEPDGPKFRMVHQNPLAEEQGSPEDRRKGGVDTPEAQALVEGDLSTAGVESSRPSE